MPNTHSSYKTDSEILKKLFELAKEKFKHPLHGSDYSTVHDDMCDEINWYEEHYDKICELLVLLERFYPQNPSMRVQE